MTNRLEDDLARLLAERAATVDVPPVPTALVDGQRRPRRTRRAAAVALVAAAAVAAVVVPVAVLSRDDQAAPPTNRPTIVPDETRRPTLELPYLAGGRLHVGDVTVTTDATALVTGGGEVYARTDGGEGWSHLVGDALRPVPWLDGAVSVAVSADGGLVASTTGAGGGDAVAIHDAASGDLVDGYVVADPGWETALLEGFDAADNLYWHDGSAIRQWRPDGTVRVVEIDHWVGLAPAGPITWDGLSERSQLVRVEHDGSLTSVAELPVSAVAAWGADGLLAYQGLADALTYVEDPTTGRRTEVATDPSARLLGWSGDLVVVGEPGGDEGSEEIVAIDPVTGRRTPVGELAAGDGGFPPLRGTGAL